VERDEDLPDTVVLRSDLQIRLDSGDTISGPYLAYFKTDSPHAAKFHVGARLRCLVNPENAWKVWVPLDAPRSGGSRTGCRSVWARRSLLLRDVKQEAQMLRSLAIF
jgi:hypothetical protein